MTISTAPKAAKRKCWNESNNDSEFRRWRWQRCSKTFFVEAGRQAALANLSWWQADHHGVKSVAHFSHRGLGGRAPWLWQDCWRCDLDSPRLVPAFPLGFFRFLVLPRPKSLWLTPRFHLRRMMGDESPADLPPVSPLDCAVRHHK